MNALTFQTRRPYINASNANEEQNQMTNTQTDLFADLIAQQAALQAKINEAAQSKKDEAKQQLEALAGLLNMPVKSLLAELFADVLKGTATTPAKGADTGKERAARSVNGSVPFHADKDYMNPYSPAQQAKKGARGKPATWPADVLAQVQTTHPTATIDDVVEMCSALHKWFGENESTVNAVEADGKANAAEKIAAQFAVIKAAYMDEKANEAAEVAKSKKATA